MMTYKLQWIIIIASLLMTKVASATEFNINAIDKDQRGSVDLSLFKIKYRLRREAISLRLPSMIFRWQMAGSFAGEK